MLNSCPEWAGNHCKLVVENHLLVGRMLRVTSPMFPKSHRSGQATGSSFHFARLVPPQADVSKEATRENGCCSQ